MPGPYIKQNARGSLFEVGDGTANPDTVWLTIGGIKQFAFTNAETKHDTTSFASGGVEEQEVMQRGQGLKIDGFFLEDVAGVRDPGQALVETAAFALGANSILRGFRWTTPGGKKYFFKASATLGDQGGGNNDKITWSVTLTRSGPTTIT